MAFDLEPFGKAGEILNGNAARLDRAFASGFRPAQRMLVSEWAAKYRRFSDDAPLPGPWRHETAPYLVEIMDALSPQDPCEEVIIRKCAQSGGTAAVENWIGFISDLAPGPMLFVQATKQAALEWSSEKLWPMIESTPRLDPAKGGSIRPLGEATGEGSTKNRLRFSRSSSYVALAGANSAAGLRSRTMRYAVEDDLDQFPDNLDGQGSPEAMVDQRLKVYRRRGLSKRAKISTPTIKGASKIDAAFSADGVDRRRPYYRCPHCGDRFVIVWDPQPEGERDIQWPDGHPEDAKLYPRCCTAEIEHWQKLSMIDSGCWLSEEIDGERTPLVLTEEAFQALRARMPQSRKRGFDIDGMLTSFQTWGDMAVEFVASRGDQFKMMGWTMLTRGAAFELRGSTPDHERLKVLRSQDWGTGQMPVGPVVLTMATDVQGDGLYTEIVGWAENAESWSLFQAFIPGATDVPGEGAWVALDQLSRRPITFPGGRAYTVDQEVVDGGYHTRAAEAYCRMRPNRMMVFGRSGWTRPILGRGEALTYERQGSRSGFASKKAEDKAYLVGVDGVKSMFYGFLRSTLRVADAEAKSGVPETERPRGLCHFSRDTPDEWFEMVTAETVVTKTVNGYPKKVWEPLPGRQNHYLDSRVYNYAAAEKLMLDTLTDTEWARLRSERYAPRDPAQGDLLALATGVAPPPAPAPVQPAPPSGDGFVDVGEGWEV
ncbi:MAG: phage terminase large subunit family protein [Brevundimonas sp.]|uniref:phage terminase large subunit family protein n=1 Tax=Brevundimonas sp. TaxID=1871086 RepID=UPI002735AD2E|nr:terminase gpA endonuclease subunit [Brevundimonas sp.]MDP3405056.1 phage terminase large subunit family protein [Brevundimonas sp.]